MSEIIQRGTLCVNCKSEVHAQARLCPICKTYQATTSRWLAFIGKFAAGFALIATAATYVVSTLPGTLDYFFGRDEVNLVSFDTLTGTIHNKGKQRVFVTHLLLESSDLNNSTTIRIARSIGPGEFYTHKAEDQQSVFWRSGTFTREEWDYLLTVQPRQNQCTEWRYFYKDDAFFQITKAKTLPARGRIFYFSERKGSHRDESFGAVTVPFFNPNPNCEFYRRYASR
jgi:hypothetical protein